MLVEVSRVNRNTGHVISNDRANLKDGDSVAAQGDVLFRWRPDLDLRNREVVPLTKITVAHGESGNHHDVVCVDRSVALEWLKQATEGPTHLTQFAYGELQPGTEVFVRIPEGGAEVRHEEHDTLVFHTGGTYGVIRQQESRGDVERNVWD